MIQVHVGDVSVTFYVSCQSFAAGLGDTTLFDICPPS